MGNGPQSATELPHPHPYPPLEGEGVAATYLKLIGAMFMWGGTWIADGVKRLGGGLLVIAGVWLTSYQKERAT